MLSKWESIDDEIWAKIIVLERNRRVAKAYARAPVLTVNGTDDGFDGFRIGLAGFENPMRDPKTEEAKRLIGQVNLILITKYLSMIQLLLYFYSFSHFRNSLVTGMQNQNGRFWQYTGETHCKE